MTSGWLMTSTFLLMGNDSLSLYHTVPEAERLTSLAATEAGNVEGPREMCSPRALGWSWRPDLNR